MDHESTVGVWTNNTSTQENTFCSVQSKEFSTHTYFPVVSRLLQHNFSMADVISSNGFKDWRHTHWKKAEHCKKWYTESNLGDATVACGDISDFDDDVVFFVYLELSRLRDDSRPSTSMSLASLFTGGSCRLTLPCGQRLITQTVTRHTIQGLLQRNSGRVSDT